MTLLSSPQRHCENCFLRACLQYYFGTATAEDIRALPQPDWTVLIELAIEKGVMPLLYQSLKRLDLDNIPRSCLVQLQHCHRMNGLHNLSQSKELVRILLQLQAAGIDVIAFKGAVLATSAYGNIALRQFFDFDILVRQQDFWQAKAALVACGYQSSTSEVTETEMFSRYLQISLNYSDAETVMLNQRFTASLLHSNRERSLDLHWGIPPRRVWKSQQFEPLWQNLQTIDFMGHPTQTLSPEAALVVQCINVAKEPWKRSLKQICDVAQIIQAFPDLNWQSALDLAAGLQSRRLLLIGMSVTHEVLQIPIPEFILKSLPVETNWERVFCAEARTQGVMQTFWWEYTNQLKTLDRLWDAFFVTQHYLGLIFKLVCIPNSKDREVLPLPNWLFLIYYFVRPLRLLMVYMRSRRSVVIANSTLVEHDDAAAV